MTRLERLAQQHARAKVRLEAQRQQLAKVEAQHRAEERKAFHTRRLLVGALVERAGLFAWMMAPWTRSLPASPVSATRLTPSPCWMPC